ncbi:MAG: hypothetical protein M3036_00625 [Bifidobacteriales bacterium]|nr:hypothetical protein [Bifidobacteriales bacterium]
MTSVIVQSDVDSMRFTGFTRYELLSHKGEVWGLEGMDGWYGTPAPRESPADIPQSDGSYMPSRLTVGSRVLTIRCLVKTPDSLSASTVGDRVCDLMTRQLTVTVSDPAGVRQCAGYLSADPATTMVFWSQAVSFSLIITCPDPLKYGLRMVCQMDKNGDLSADNPGPLPAWPHAHVDGPVQQLSLSQGGRQVAWQGSADSLDLDFRDMIPSAGELVQEQAFRLPPGSSVIQYTVSPGARLTVTFRPAWR